MFKNLVSRTEDPGFADAIILTNKSQHWLRLTDAGHQMPPFSYAALDSSLAASSDLVSEHVKSGLLVILAQEPVHNPAKSKRKKKQETVDLVKPIDEIPEQSQILEELVSDILVAEPEPDNWVSSNENIVGFPTTDDI